MNMSTVSVSVPEDRVADLYNYAATLIRGEEPGGDDGDLQLEPTRHWSPGFQAAATDPDAIKQAYLGGHSRAWRPFLRHLATRPGEWVPFPDAMKAVDRTVQQGIGMVGAGERRCRGRLPYDKRWEHGRREYRMPDANARVVRDLG